jgi:periplasmic protein CpxP/Spy
MTLNPTLSRSLIAAALLTVLGITGCAQSGAATTGTAASGQSREGMHGERMGRHDPAKMQAYMAERMAKRQAELKAKLQITPAQETAWSAFVATLQPAMMMGERQARPDMSQLTTPERIDQMRAMRTQRMNAMTTRMDQRDNAAKALYAVLAPEQRKVFDTETLPKRGGHHAGMGGGMGHHGYHHGK